MFTGRWADNVLYPGGAIVEHEELFWFSIKSIEKILALANIDAGELDFVAIKRSSEVGCK